MPSTARTPASGRPPSPSPSQVPLPASPTYSYASTANPLSQYNLPLPPPPRPTHAVLSKADLEQSQLAYSDLLATAKSYRIALASLSSAASAFGSALEACARLKEARAETLGPPTGTSLTNSFTTKGSCTAELLLSASGVHHLIANHQQILSETVYKSFEVPLLHELDQWRRNIDGEDETYKREVAARSREIRRLEKEGLKLHRQSRRRDVAKFREHLVTLTAKLDGLTGLHADHARTLLRDSQEASAKILDASCSLVRAEVDIFEGLARKGWTGGGLDDLLEKGQDLFASDEDGLPGAAVATVAGVTLVAANSAVGEGGAKLFSILPPKSILANDAASASVSDSVLTSRAGGGRADSLVVDPEEDQFQSLTGAVGQPQAQDRERNGEDSESIFSESNMSRGLRPFSPQPIRRRPTDVVMDPEELLLGGGGGGGVEEEFKNDIVSDAGTDADVDDDDGYDAATVRGASNSPGRTLEMELEEAEASLLQENDEDGLNGDRKFQERREGTPQRQPSSSSEPVSLPSPLSTGKNEVLGDREFA